MKQKMEWHEECIKNWRTNSDKDLYNARREMQRALDRRKELDFYLFQIESAKEEGRTEFDRDRYKISQPMRRPRNQAILI